MSLKSDFYDDFIKDMEDTTIKLIVACYLRFLEKPFLYYRTTPIAMNMFMAWMVWKLITQYEQETYND